MRRLSIGGMHAGATMLLLTSGLWACGHQEAERKTAVENKTAAPAPQKTGIAVARDIMAQWKEKNPGREWIEKERETHVIVPPVDNKDLVGDPQGHTYGRVTDMDVRTWQRETLRLVADGSRVFHSADELSSTIAVSCDMCHPDAANTHPETYPKFQVQMGRVALLRDMINWCIEQAVRGQRLAPDSTKMRALEAYIYAQRKGTPLQYGKR